MERLTAAWQKDEAATKLCLTEKHRQGTFQDVLALSTGPTLGSGIQTRRPTSATCRELLPCHIEMSMTPGYELLLKIFEDKNLRVSSAPVCSKL